jgi:hypothetical protein
MNNNGARISLNANVYLVLSRLSICFIQDARAYARISGDSGDNLTPRSS